MPHSFRFAEFELDVEAFALRRGRDRVKLEKLPMEVLILLVSEAGALVSRGKLQALWGSDVFLEHDAAINTAIRKIRHALGDDADKPRFVETVVGKGYRFIAPVGRPGAQSPFPSFFVARGKREYMLKAGENVLGRDPAAAVYIDHASVSRRHARISIEADGAILEDLNSRNGTFLDGQQVGGPTTLTHGAVIGLGPVTLTFRVQAAPPSTLPVKTAGDA
jgi:DNA-binding winged helix-turn-helix (wHTH) protein